MAPETMNHLNDYKVIVFTCAYNVEKVLERTIQSVLNQTHGNFEYYLFDNASTDRTWEVIQEYAHRDKRIIPNGFDFNTFGRAYEFIYSIEDYSKMRYFVILDSDDEYVPQAFELLLKTVLETGADIVGANSFYIDADTGEPRDKFTLEKDMVIEGDDFDMQFPQYYKYMRTVWGKMYDLYKLVDPIKSKSKSKPKPKSKLSLGEPYYEPPAISNSFTAWLFFLSKKIYILKNRLYRYYIRSNSISRQYYENRFGSIKKSYKNNAAYLAAKTRGQNSAENSNFILYEAFKEIRITLPKLFSAQIKPVKKLRELIGILSDDIVRAMYRQTDFACVEKYILLDSVREWLSRQNLKAGLEEDGLTAEVEACLSELLQDRNRHSANHIDH